MQALPAVGDRVTIPWGLDEVEGEVVAAYSSGRGPYVTVEVCLEGTDEPITVTFPAEAIRSARAA